MGADSKTSLDQVKDGLAPLREMRHYGQIYMEQLSAHCLLFDGPLKQLGQAGRFDDLMGRQIALHVALDAQIAELEALAASLALEGDAAC